MPRSAALRCPWLDLFDNLGRENRAPVFDRDAPLQTRKLVPPAGREERHTMPPPKLGQVVETVLYTSDVAQSAAWYRDKLGLEPFTSGPAVCGFSLPNSTILLIFDRAQVTHDRAVPGGVIPRHGTETGLGQHIAFACAGGPEEVEVWTRHLEDKGVDIIGRMEWERGGRSVYFKDWEGHVLEIMTRGVWSVY